MICGGLHGRVDRCFKFEAKNWVESNRMSQGRVGAGAGGVTIGNQLLASGGIQYTMSFDHVRSQELIGLNTKSSYPDLPSNLAGLQGHCIVKDEINDHIVIFGGVGPGVPPRYNRRTYIAKNAIAAHTFKDEELMWWQAIGPNMYMNEERQNLGCTIVKVGNKQYIMAVGGTSENDNTHKSIEYLDISNWTNLDYSSKWVRGHPLPRDNSSFLVRHFAMATTPDADEVYMLGGNWEGGKYKKYKWSCQDSTLDSCRFRGLTDEDEFVTMQGSRISRVAIPLPEELAYDICAY